MKLRTLLPTGCLTLALVMSAHGQDRSPAKAGEEAFNAGNALMKNAEKAQTLSGTIAYLSQAIDQYRASAAIQPGDYLTNAMWAKALEALVRQTAATNLVTQIQRQQWAHAALERFAAAEGCSGSDWRVDSDWGDFLTYHAGNLATDAMERVAELAKAQQLLEKGLAVAPLRTDQASVEGKLGQCLVRLAALQGAPEERRRLYQQAVGKFQSAHDKSEVMTDADVYGDWGAALLELGKIDKDPVLLLQAVDQLEASLRKQPGNFTVRFNLVRAYAVLKETGRALKELRTCAETDAAATVASTKQEPDLEALRGEAEFQQIVGGQAVGTTPEAVFQIGLRLQQKAEASEQPEEAVEYYRKAIEQYQAAVEGKKDYYPAQFLWGHCLGRLAQLSSDPKERPVLTRSAYERLSIAAQNPSADWRVHYDWAMLLIGHGDILATTPEEQMKILQEGREHFEKARSMTDFSGDKATVDRDLAVCLISIAERTPDSNRRPLYQRAVNLLEGVTARAPKIMKERYYGLWGVTLLQLAKLNTDRMMIRQATERLLTALDMDPKNNEARYNLVCAYALLDQTDYALRHLRICLENDDAKRTMYTHAAKDPDLDSLRRTRDFNELFSGKDGGTMPNVQPQITDR